MSEVKVNKISPRTACGTVTLGDSGDTFTIPSGATITNNGTQTGFGRTGTVDWVTTPKVTGDSPITAVTGEGYFLNTTAGTITINLPAGAAGSIVSMADYAATWQTNNVTVNANGTEKIGGVASRAVVLDTEGQSVTLVFVDSTQGWINTMDSTSNVRGNAYMVATGGTPCTGAICGDCKVHTFTGPGTFTVSAAAICAADNLVSYMVVAGGGAGGNAKAALNGFAGGAGAGGFRELVSPTAPYTASPLDGYPSAPNRITVTATGYPITVGSGGTDGGDDNTGGVGNNSVFSSITSAGGGGGQATGGTTSGGSGGGAGPGGSAGTGNSPPTTPAQGFPGGTESPNTAAGGGGATVAGTNGIPGGPAGPGGAGATSSITGSPVARAGGGGGGGNCGETGGGTGGSGGGGAGGDHPAGSGTAGTVNTGGGGGATSSASGSPVTAGSGGSGTVIIRYKFQ